MDRYTSTICRLVSAPGTVPRQAGRPRSRPAHPRCPPHANPSHQARAGALQAPRRPPAEHPAHNDPQVMACHLHEVALAHLPQAPQPTPPRPAALTDVGERPLHVLAPLLLQALAAGAAAAPPVVPVRLLPARRLIGPHTPLSPPLLPDIRPHACAGALRQ